MIPAGDARTLAGVGVAALLALTVSLPAGGPAPAAAPEWDVALRDARTIDVNQADASELERLPGVGPALAARIVDERRQRGRFAAPEDLLRVRGIGRKSLDALREHLTFDSR
jgi:competence protein ComEA